MLAGALVLTWYFAAVHISYNGNWSALFLTGEAFPVPAELASENIYVFRNSAGYDGQFYHYIAHDPFQRRGFAKYTDAPHHREQRILIPLLTWMLALGRDEWIDGMMFAVHVALLVLGVWWSSQIAIALADHALWGLAFLALPAPAIVLERFVPDVAITTFAAVFVLGIVTARPGPPYMLMLAAPLAKESGLLFAAASCTEALRSRQWRRAILVAMTAAPFAAWYAFLATRFPLAPDIAERNWIPLVQIVRAIANPAPYHLPAPIAWTLVTLDYAAITGALLAFGLALRRWPATFLDKAIVIQALFGILLATISQREAWQESVAYGRYLSPLLLMLAVRGRIERSWIHVTPAVLITLRIVVPEVRLIAPWLKP